MLSEVEMTENCVYKIFSFVLYKQCLGQHLYCCLIKSKESETLVPDSFDFVCSLPRLSQPARSVRPVAARFVDTFLKKLLLKQFLVVELTNLAYFNSLGLSIHFLKKLFL